MAWRGSLSRTFVSAARSSSIRSSNAAPRFRTPPFAAPRQRPARLPFANPRTMGELGCAQSLMPLAGVRLTSHLAVRVRACCELSHGLNGKDG